MNLRSQNEFLKKRIKHNKNQARQKKIPALKGGVDSNPTKFTSEELD